MRLLHELTGEQIAVISALLTVIQKYPDRPLGQAIVNACGEFDLFDLSDVALAQLLTQYVTTTGGEGA